MWAAYQGDALSVDLLLRHGANPNLKDDAGLSPLHWAVVKGNRVAIRRLIEKGADLTVKDGEGRTPRDMAVELRSLGAWKRALEEGGMDEYGVKHVLIKHPTSLESFLDLLYGLHIVGSRAWCNPSSDEELKSIIEDLASEGRLNGQTFCIQCMARKPLRSKHCRVCDKCVARSDHHCPWVWNCVGSNNHRQFLLFVLTLVIGIIIFDYLTYQYFAGLTLSTNPSDISPSCPLPGDLCAITAYDTFLVSVAIWATLQLTWTSVLLASQLWQVARQMTTLEVSNLGRYGFMGGRGGASLSGQMGHRHQHRHDSVLPGVDTEDTSLVGNDAASGSSSGHVHRHSGFCAGCGSGFLMNLLGFDRFTKGRAVDGLARAGKASNPFDMGMVSNCRDFWTAGKELGVEYEKLYDVPSEGFREAKLRRMREEDEDGLRKPAGRKGLFMGFGLGRAGSSRGGYEPVSQA
ncbi:DHHC palmitoyltransferase-domain-containing protein [Panaeolus papilionaceus]|nr:DHHC palmitoyltransferase-domain-containing protein [Panaeolus papilionaceus]